MWKQHNNDDSTDEDEAHSTSDSDAEAASKVKHCCDEDGYYYFGDPSKIDDLLNVKHYAEIFDHIPEEELYASAIQHPAHADYVWLLHTRRLCHLFRTI